MSKSNIYSLDYLFIAECMNGIVSQTPSDVSRVNPTKSAFYDVLQNLPVKKFSLIGKGHMFVVDFKDLHMEVDGKVVPAKKIPPNDAKISLIYWREVTQVLKNELKQEESLISHIKRRFLQSTPHGARVRYVIGWEAMKDGKQWGSETMTID